MSMRGQLTYPEISSQAEALAAAWKQLDVQVDWLNKYIGNPSYDEVVFIGSGSSYYQALTMAVTFRKWTGRVATAYPSSEIFLFRDQTVAANRKILLVGVSRSGESTEVILALKSVAHLSNWDTCGITCYEDCTMAQISECLISPLGKEKSTVMTKSLASMTFLMQAAIAKVSGEQQWVDEMEAVLEQDEAVVREADALVKPFIEGKDFKKFVYLGMGAYGGLAMEACLKLKEMSYVWTESYGTMEFRHGPKSIVEPGTIVCLLLSQTARAYELKVAQEMKDYGAEVILIAAIAGEDTAFADLVIEVGLAQVSDEARSVLYLPAAQYLGYYTAYGLGLNPDEPRNLTQVVQI
ncbi:SIS domain-containing protein [Paenibacillus sp. N1-5-1-14]|uniref:SIS domain-containing protein n=1 Tax=Paenibacillus radicibacter TaxID=2972488 RepID=UPI00215906EF|nr:SIS domain-containing protein [Paenibacillus radicibacter]MCR8642458.1 SIS domain-containing protein [Paenibacillus radicibacter]